MMEFERSIGAFGQQDLPVWPIHVVSLVGSESASHNLETKVPQRCVEHGAAHIGYLGAGPCDVLEVLTPDAAAERDPDAIA
jgi:hypothetical protein